MWTCKVCSKSIEDGEPFCYHCGTPPSVDDRTAARIREKREARRLKCLRCRTPLHFAGVKYFHEGRTAWGFWLGNLGELLTGREAYDVYVCPHCGRLEFFVDGIGDELRAEPEDR